MFLTKKAAAQNVVFDVFDPTGGKISGVGNITSLAIALVFWVGMGLSLVFIIMSGIKLMQSKGDPREIQSAQQSLTWSIAGAVVVMASAGIVKMIGGLLGMPDIKIIPDF